MKRSCLMRIYSLCAGATRTEQRASRTTRVRTLPRSTPSASPRSGPPSAIRSHRCFRACVSRASLGSAWVNDASTCRPVHPFCSDRCRSHACRREGNTHDSPPREAANGGWDREDRNVQMADERNRRLASKHPTRVFASGDGNERVRRGAKNGAVMTASYASCRSCTVHYEVLWAR